MCNKNQVAILTVVYLLGGISNINYAAAFCKWLQKRIYQLYSKIKMRSTTLCIIMWQYYNFKLKTQYRNKKFIKFNPKYYYINIRYIACYLDVK